MVILNIYTLPNMTTGIDDAIVETVREVSLFTPMFLVFIFMVVLIGGAINQKRRMGSADIPMWTTMASLTTFMVSLVLTLRAGLIGLDVLSIVVAVTIFSGMWLFFDRNRNEI